MTVNEIHDALWTGANGITPNSSLQSNNYERTKANVSCGPVLQCSLLSGTQHKDVVCASPSAESDSQIDDFQAKDHEFECSAVHTRISEETVVINSVGCTSNSRLCSSTNGQRHSDNLRHGNSCFVPDGVSTDMLCSPQPHIYQQMEATVNHSEQLVGVGEPHSMPMDSARINNSSEATFDCLRSEPQLIVS